MKTIRGKLVKTYSIVIASFLLITVLLLNITARTYLQQNLEKNLYAEANVMEELYRERLAAKVIAELPSDSGEGLNDDTAGVKEVIKRWFKDISKISRLGFSSDLALVLKSNNAHYNVFTPGNSAHETNIRSITSQALSGKLLNQPWFFKVSAQGQPYYAVSRPIGIQSDQNQPKLWLLVFVPVSEIDRLVNELNMKAFLSIILALLVAAVFTHYFSHNISKPIKNLQQHALLISAHDFKSRVDIKTGDEIESLANAMNTIAHDLDAYEQGQKRMIQNVTHELKTPVMSIMGYAEALRDDVAENRERAFDIIITECGRLTRLIDEIMFLSKLESVEGFVELHPAMLNEVIGATADKMEALIRNAGLVLHLDIKEDVLLLLDRDKMIQALMNLLSNAVRYAKSAIYLSTAVEPERVQIIVEDDGEGLPEEAFEKVFERFYKGKMGKTGLGMTITRTIITLHKGTIQAGNSAHGGAKFAIWLPLNVKS